MCDLAKDCPNVKFYKVVHNMLGLGLCSIKLGNGQKVFFIISVLNVVIHGMWYVVCCVIGGC